MHNRGEGKDFDFGKRASFYDKGVEGRLSRRFYQLILDNVRFEEGAHVLDVGCGTGALLKRIADSHPIVGFGIDIESEMIEQARLQCPDMMIQCARGEHTPFEDAGFDALITCMAYHHFSDKAGFAREAKRILKPDGRLYIADVRFPTPIRQALNGFFRHRGIAGEFCMPEQIIKNFAPYGFQSDGIKWIGISQLVILRKDPSHGH